MTHHQALRRACIAAAAAASLGAGSAFAQVLDLDPYVRIDAGYAFTANASGNIAPQGNGYGNDFGSGFAGGGGIGVKFGHLGPVSFRVDFTGFATSSLGGTHTGTLSDGTAISTKAKLNNITELATVYVDVATPMPITPFVGFGFGSAQNRVGALTFTNSAGAFGTINPNRNSDTAWSFTAGASYPVMPHIEIEIAYRYTSAGTVRSGTTITDLTTNPPVSGTLDGPLASRLNLQQIGASLRFVL